MLTIASVFISRIKNITAMCELGIGLITHRTSSRPRWKLKHAYPACAMILSSTMLHHSTASMLQLCPTYQVRSSPYHYTPPEYLYRPHLLQAYCPLPLRPPSHWSRVPKKRSRHSIKIPVAMRCHLRDTILTNAINDAFTGPDYMDQLFDAQWSDLVKIGSYCASHLDSLMQAAPIPQITPAVDFTLSSETSLEDRLKQRYGDLSDCKLSNAATSAIKKTLEDPPGIEAPFILSCRHDPEDAFTVILDTGTTFAVTNDIADFPNGIQYGKLGTITQVDGAKATMDGFGIGVWKVTNTSGQTVHINVPMFYVPQSKQRLFSPQDYSNYHKLPNHKDTYGGNGSFFWFKLEQNKGKVVTPIDYDTNIPIALMTHIAPAQDQDNKNCSHAAIASDASENGEHEHNNDNQDSSAGCCNLNSSIHTLDEDNENLTPAQKELLLDHQRLGHINMSHLKTLYKDHKVTCEFDGCTQDDEPACLPSRHQAITTCSAPLCFACQQAKAHKRPTGVKHNSDVSTRSGILSRDKLYPGDLISVDQYQSSIKGRLSNTTGREADSKKYCGGTIFYDHASGLIKNYNQTTLTADETLTSKRLFEHECAKLGFRIKKYHTDNGIFDSQALANELEQQGQDIAFSGVGAKHMNGAAERSIKTLVTQARAMLLHAQLHWPDETHIDLWPFALDYASWLYNHTPNRATHLAPLEIFTSTKSDHEHLRRAKVFGCPAYVLDPKLQDGSKLPKWSPRSRLGQFLGFSPKHSSTVGLIRHIATGYCSTQYHVVYDEKFTTVSSRRRAIDLTETWIDLLSTSRENLLDGHNTETDGPFPDLDPHWLPPDERDPQDDLDPVPSDDSDPNDSDSDSDSDTDSDDDHSEYDPFDSDDEDKPPAADTASKPFSKQGETPSSPKQGETPSSTKQGEPLSSRRRSRRLQGKPPARFDDSPMNLGTTAQYIDWSSTYGANPYLNTFQRDLNLATDPLSGEIHYQHPLMYAAKLNQLEEFEPTYRQIAAMPEGPTKTGWRNSMQRELDALFVDRKAIDIVPKTEAGDNQIVPLMWRFVTKLNPDGSEKKKKSRLVVRGDLQQNEEHTDKKFTFAPVVDFATVRLFFNLCLQHNLKTVQIDFDNAFLQGDLPEPLYLQIPPPFCAMPEYKDKCFRTTRSFYGDCRAGRIWYDKLAAALLSEKYGFKRSLLDPCLFLRHDCMIILYTDDLIFGVRDTKVATDVMDLLANDGFAFDREDTGTIDTYLGIDIEHIDESTIKLSQRNLTQRIIDALHLETAANKDTPASGILTPAEDEPDFDQVAFNYRSVIGMLLYLTGNTRNDCTFAVSQAARFSNNPKISHARALKRIGRYLRGTIDEGMYIRKIPPGQPLTIDCAVDADFAGLWDPATSSDPTTCRSRTGYVITLGGNPILWYSKLQDCISLHTMESEYIALSTAMKPLLHLRNLYFEIATTMDLPFSKDSRISTVFEDNQACIALATTNPPRLTPRSKSIGIKYHWFRSHLSDEIKIQYIASAVNPADQYTKPLLKELFQACRRLNLGW